jgi:hypothetical protein
MFKARRLRRSRNLSGNRKDVTPKSFLIKLSPNHQTGRTVTEEIFDEENFRFYQKVVSSRSNSPAKTPQPSRNISPHKGSINESPWSIRKAKIALISSKKPQILPSLTSRKESLQDFIRRESEVKLEKIMKNCDETREQVVESSSRLSNLAKQECLMTKLYTQEMKWTADKIMEVNGFGSDIMKTLFDEHKQSRDFYENEKNLLLKKINERNTKDFKAKANRIKKMMTEYRQKLIP